MDERKARKLAAYRAAREHRAGYEAELDAKSGKSQEAGAARRRTSNSRYDWRRSKGRQTPQRFEEPQVDQSDDPTPGPAPRPKPEKPGLLFGGRAKSYDEMRQQRRKDNGV